MELQLTFETKSDATPRTLAFPPRWLDNAVDRYDEDDDSNDPAIVALDAWDKIDYKEQTTEAWLKLQPSDTRLDEAWVALNTVGDEARFQALRDDLSVETWLPKELREILNILIEKGPHRVTAPACMLEALGKLIEAEADDASDHDKEYELSVLRTLLVGDNIE